MGDFNYEKKENYTQAELDTLLGQHHKYVSGQVHAELETALKDKYITEGRSSLIREQFVTSVPEKNREVVEMLLKDKDIPYIQEKYPHLLVNDIPVKSIVDVMTPTDKTPLLSEQAIYEKVKNNPEKATKAELGIASEYGRKQYNAVHKIK